MQSVQGPQQRPSLDVPARRVKKVVIVVILVLTLFAFERSVGFLLALPFAMLLLTHGEALQLHRLARRMSEVHSKHVAVACRCIDRDTRRAVAIATSTVIAAGVTLIRETVHLLRALTSTLFVG